MIIRVYGLEILSSEEEFVRELRRVNELSEQERGKVLGRWIKFLEENGYVEMDGSMVYMTPKLKELLSEPEAKPSTDELKNIDVAEWVGADATRRIFLENDMANVTAREFAELSGVINGLMKLKVLGFPGGR